MATLLNVMVSGMACATTEVPLQPAPKATIGIALVKRKLVGSDSTKPTPDCAGLVPVFANVNTSVVEAPSIMVAAPQALVSTGGTVLTTTHWLVTPLMTPLDGAILALPFVNAAGSATQLALVKPARFVTADTVIVQLAVAAAMVTPLNATVSGMACVIAVVPAQPAPKVIVGAAEVKRSEAGNDSVNEIPLCAGLVPLLVKVKIRLVVPASLMVAADHALVKVGLTVLTTKHWSVDVLVARLVVTFAVKLVKAAGLPTQEALVCVGEFVRSAIVTVQLDVVNVIATPVIPDSTLVIAS